MSKIDCSITENYLKEKARMTKSIGVDRCGISCITCPLYCLNNECKMSCRRLENKRPEKAIAIVQKWSDEHPVKTIKDDFLEKYPNARLDAQGTPVCCTRSLGYFVFECLNECEKCWNTPLSEVQK